jgi:hypothetical protein
MVTKYLILSILKSIIGDYERHKKAFLGRKKTQRIEKKPESK